MKPSKFLACAAVGFLLASCSADDPMINPGSNGETFEGDGYLAITINLPTTRATRALNDQFNDGDDDGYEYQVDNAVFVLFKGKNEADAKCMAAYDISDIDPKLVGSTEDNITSRFKQAIKIENVSLETDEHLYGFVMLNYKNIASVFDNRLVMNGAVVTDTFKEFLKRKSSLPLYSEKGDVANNILMSNAPLATSAGGLQPQKTPTTGVQTLVELKGTLYATKDEALKDDNLSGDIYVERAVAKATLKVTPKTASTSGKSLKIKKVQWVIANDEQETFLVRNLTDENIPVSPVKIGGHDLSYLTWSSNNLVEKPNYRFLGNTPVAENLYRHYWCIDPAYHTDKEYKDVTPEEIINETSKALYCHENTFDVAHQNYRNTTRAVLKVTYEDGTFYTLNGDLKTAYDQSDVETYALNYIVLDSSLQKAINGAVRPGVQNVDIPSHVIIDWEDEGYMHKVKDIRIKPDTDAFTATPEFDAASLVKATNELYKIVKYENGVSYYDFRFMHFGSHEIAEDLAPWTEPENAKTPDVNASYGYGSPKKINDNSEIDYLGRWGMVRNNWYSVEITKFNTVGSPVVPDAKTGKPDDNTDTEQWLSFRINILAWAMRTQQFVL